MNRIDETEPFWKFPAQEMMELRSVLLQPQDPTWADLLDLFLDEVNEWLTDPINAHDAIAAVESVLIEKHHDYGEDNLHAFGELGILVRASDKVARLKNLVEKQAEVADETLDDTWRDLAGYALQALIMRKQRTLRSSADCAKGDRYFEIRKSRLIRGMCPDCGRGALLSYRSMAGNRLYCSDRCGFSADFDLHDPLLPFADFEAMINQLAARSAAREQK